MDGAAIREGRDSGTTETDDTMLDGWLCMELLLSCHSAGARPVTMRYSWKLGPTQQQMPRPGLGRSFLFFRKHRCLPQKEEAFPFDKPSQAHKHQLASSTSLFDHDHWRSCLALQLKHHRHLNYTL
jgi:hypothetical protein